jgi:cobalt-zinc-cadmium efflux system outer membrane protein
LAVCQTLDIETLERLVIENNYQLLARAKQINIQHGKLSQSRKLPNPVLGFVSGSGADPETSGMISQTIQLGGKRKHKIKLSELELEKVELEYEKLKLEKLTVAFQLFVKILHLQELKSLQNDRISVAEELLISVSKKVEAGKLSPAEHSRAKIQHFQEQMKLNVLNTELERVWISISALYGGEKTSFDYAEGDFRHIPIIARSNILDNSLAIKLAELSVDIQRIAIKSEKAEAIPNLDMGAGLKRSDVPGNTFQIGLSISIPIFNRNQGNIQSAVFGLDGKAFALKSVESQLMSEYVNIKKELDLLYSETTMLKEEIIPEAQNAYIIISDGYLNGRFSYLDVVDAQKMWFLSRSQYLDALKKYHYNIFELNRISGNNNQTTFKERSNHE